MILNLAKVDFDMSLVPSSKPHNHIASYSPHPSPCLTQVRKLATKAAAKHSSLRIHTDESELKSWRYEPLVVSAATVSSPRPSKRTHCHPAHNNNHNSCWQPVTCPQASMATSPPRTTPASSSKWTPTMRPRPRLMLARGWRRA